MPCKILFSPRPATTVRTFSEFTAAPAVVHYSLRDMSRTLFCPASHLWARLRRAPAGGAGLVAARSAWRVEVGLTVHALEDIGDVIAVGHGPTAPGNRVEAGAALLTLDWEAHRVSTADELYHTQWALVEGAHPLHSPFGGTLLGLCSDDDARRLGPETVLATLHVDRPGLAASQLVGEAQYLAAVRGAPPGRFGRESTLHEQHSIGGHRAD